MRIPKFEAQTEWNIPTEFPDLRQVEEIAIDLETKDPDLKEKGSGSVIGNGDVKTAQDVLDMMKQTGCDGVMVGRAALGNPWFFNEAVSLFHEGKPSSTPSINQRIIGCKKHFDHMLLWHGEKAGTNLMRKHFGWYIRGFDGASYVRKSLVSALDKKEMISILNSIV